MDAAQTQHYQYDGASRLIQAALAGGNAASFGYDAVSNRINLSNTSPASSTAYSIAAGSNRMTQSTTAGVTRNFTYNPVGDITAFTNSAGIANALGYDPFGRLASHTKSGVTTSYTVNALDQRMAKSKPGTSSRYAYAGFNQLLAENTNGQWTSYLWNGGEPIAMVRNNQIYYLHNDHLGRPELVTAQSKAIAWKAKNQAFGREVQFDDFGNFPVNLGFPGQYYDAESGLWHNGYREYLADAGRYLQSDPIRLGGGVNTYAYTNGNPVNRIDPSGLLWYGGHFSITYRAARSSGFGFRDSLRLAWQVMAVDWRQGSQGTTPDATKLHAMASPGQSCPDATKAANDLIAGKDPDYANDIAARIHAAQDGSAPWHYGQTWDGNITFGHVWNDVFYGDAVGDAAYGATMGILGDGP